MNNNGEIITNEKKESYLILISGPAASGKSTLVERLSNIFSAYTFKPSQSYLKIAQERNIPVAQAFSAVAREDAEEHFCRICKSNKMVIGDQHLAIQYNRDSSLAISISTNGDAPEIDDSEEYVPTLSKEFMDQLTNSGVKVLLILLEADSKILYSRAQDRYKDVGQHLRNDKIEQVIREMEAERKFFDELIKESNINSCVIDTSLMDKEEVVRNAVQRVCEFKRPIRSTSEWTR